MSNRGVQISHLLLSNLAEKYCPPFARPVLDRVKGSPIARRLVSGAFWSVLGNGLAKGLTFLAMILVARILGKETFGEFGLVRSTAAAFMTVSAFGMGLTATKYISELLHTDKERVGRIIGLSYVFTFVSSFFVALAFWITTPWLCETQLHAPHLVGVMRLGAVLLFFTTLMTAQTGVMQGFQDFRGLALATFLGGLVMLPIYVAGAYWFGLWGAVIGAILAIILNVGINSVLIYRDTKKYDIKYDFLNVKREWGVLLHFGLPGFLCSVTYSISFWACQMMLGAQNDGATQLGLFYAALTIYTILVSVPTMLAPVFMSMMSESHGQRDAMRYKKVVGASFVTNVGIACIMACPFIIFPETMMRFCFGAEFVDGGATLAILAAASVMFVACSVVDQIVASKNRMWFNYAYSFLGSMTTLGITYWLVPIWGNTGLATAFLCGFITRIIIIPLLVLVRRV
ncbi:MAG: oligosaccharide flippase family protein [Thermoguttaceae bacterium]